MESRLQALEEQVARLAERIEQLEQHTPGGPLPALPKSWPLTEARVAAPAARVEVSRWVTFLGRSCLVLGGAFLSRALTDSGVLSAGPGVALGVGFAATWLVLAHRAAMAGAKLSAGFHGAIAALIGYSLVLESSTRLAAMTASTAALTLCAFTGLLLLVAWRNRLVWLAWVGVSACGTVTILLLRATGARGQLTGALFVLAAVTFFWLSERWPALRWVPAVLLDWVLLRGIFASAPLPAVAFLALAILSVALVLSRTAAARALDAFDIAQAIAGLLIAVAGGLRLAHEAGTGTGRVAVGMIALSLVAAGVAGWVVHRRGDRPLDFLFYAALSLGLLSSAAGLLTTGDSRGVLWSGLAFIAVLIGRRSHALILSSLAALLGLGAALSTGSISGQVTRGGAIALGLMILAYVWTVPRPTLPAPSARAAALRLPAAALLLLACVSTGELLVHGVRGLGLDAAQLGAARTITAVAIALVLALTRRMLERPELTWVAMLALVVGGIELALVGLPSGRASTLLVSFVVYGAALILVPRLAPPGRDLLLSSRPSEPRMVIRS